MGLKRKNRPLADLAFIGKISHFCADWRKNFAKSVNKDISTYGRKIFQQDAKKGNFNDKMVIRKRSNSFTLLEVLLGITLLACASAAISINVPRLIRFERFESGVERIVNEIAFAKELMLLYQTDVFLTLEAKDKGIKCSYHIAESDVKRGFKMKSDKPLFLKGIEKMDFDGKRISEVTLSFKHENYETTEGSLTFSVHDKEKTIILESRYEKTSRASCF